MIILNYDETGITPSLTEKAILIEGVQPDNFDSLEKFRVELLRLVNAAGISPLRGRAVVLLDVSGSMGVLYDSDDVRSKLRKLLSLEWLSILRFNTGIVEGGDLPGDALVRTGGGTDLARAFAETVALFGPLDTLLVVTDGHFGDGVPDVQRPSAYYECPPDQLADAIEWLEAVRL